MAVIGVCWALGVGLGAGAQTQGLPSSAPMADAAAAEPVRSSPPASGDNLMEFLAQQRQILAMQRDAILADHEKQKRACWQKFAVNPCLTEARRARRQALEPIHQQELALNAQERVWRTGQRDLRLQNKAIDRKDQP